ncbi:MAG TPA: DinB family protein [Vicinamibacterales bacterium]|nr:DinB family protein [Vicinamibacterales bacterium]
MSETPQQYQARILALGDAQDPWSVLRSTAARLREVIDRNAATVIDRRPAPHRWSIREIIAHLSDAEVVFAYRVRIMIATPGATIHAFDQNEWAAGMQYDRVDPAGAVDRFAVLRRGNLELIERLPDLEAAYGMHEERGRESAALFVRLYAGHDRNHLNQIDAILNGTR